MKKYRQKQLELMTDRQLDAICAVHNGYGYDWVERHPDLVPNYCNTWVCCGELIDELGGEYPSMTIEEDRVYITDTWRNSTVGYSCSSNSKRNIVVVYILVMQDS